MNNFQLSSKIDPNKVFLRKRSELEKRLDPHQYHPERLSTIAELFKNNQCLKLRHGALFQNIVTNIMSENDVYVGLENIESNTGKYIPSTEKNTISSANIFKKGQILFPKLRPYLNKVYLAEFDGICSTEFHVLNTNERFLDEFLAIYLRSKIIVNQTKHLMTGNTLPRLQTQDIYNLPVPVIPIEKQRKIVLIYNRANNNKLKKEQEAQALLNSIDDYLMKELGIELPEINNSLEDRVFITVFSKVSGDKWNTAYHWHNLDFKKQGGFICLALNVLSDGAIFQGVSSSSNDGFIEAELLKVKNILRHNQIDYGDTTPVEFNSKEKVLQDLDIISPFIGEAIRQYKFSIYRKENINHTIDNNVGVIRISDHKKYNPYYVCEVLNSSIGKIQIDKEVGGGGVPFLGSRVKRFNIPIISFKKQNDIVAHIQLIREKAKQLQNNAQQQFEDAKKEIERIILGESL